MSKNILLDECLKVLQDPKVETWYTKNLTGRPQKDTIRDLARGVESGDLDLKSALAIAFIVGFQWMDKFKGVP